MRSSTVDGAATNLGISSVVQSIVWVQHDNCKDSEDGLRHSAMDQGKSQEHQPPAATATTRWAGQERTHRGEHTRQGRVD